MPLAIQVPLPTPPALESADQLGWYAAAVAVLALAAMMLLIARAALAERKSPGPSPSWDQDRGVILSRLETIDSEVKALRKDRHEEATRIQAILGKLDLLAQEDRHLCERIDRLEERA